jgi:hypothetical protein
MSKINYIALTSANEPAMSAVAEQLIRASARAPFPLALMVGVRDAQAAQAIYADGGELWRIGDDDSRPELDALVDRTINDSEPELMARQVNVALDRFLGKVRVAA